MAPVSDLACRSPGFSNYGDSKSRNSVCCPVNGGDREAHAQDDCPVNSGNR